MRKIIQYVLIGVNILIVLVLLVMSGIMIYFSSAKQGTIFGYTAMIYTTFNEDDSAQHSLYIVDSGERSVNIGDEIAFMRFNDEWNSVPYVDTVVNITDGIAEMRDVDEMFELDSPDYIGRVSTKNPQLGEKLYAFTTGKISLTFYVVFGGGFVLLSLVVILLFAMKMKRDALMSIVQEEPDELAEPPIEDDDSCDCVDEEGSLSDENDDIIMPVEDIITDIIDDTSDTMEIEEIGTTKEIALQVPPLKVDRSERSKEIDFYIDEIIRNAQTEFEKTYHQEQ